MMPASNNGVGMSLGFPDVKLTPPLGVPVPYPNMALNAMSAVFSPNIFVGYMPQLHMASIKPITLGNQAGVMHPLYMNMGGYTAGNPRVLINCIPATHLCTPTWGNLFNNPVGIVAVPSITTTHYSDAHACHHADASRPLEAHETRALRAAVRGDASAVRSESLAPGVGYIVIERFTSDLGARFFNAMRALDVSRGLVLDLRGCPAARVVISMPQSISLANSRRKGASSRYP
jgi:carboxyl-terminal processing protease